MKTLLSAILLVLPTAAAAHTGHVAPHGFEWLDGALAIGLLAAVGLLSFGLFRNR